MRAKRPPARTRPGPVSGAGKPPTARRDAEYEAEAAVEAWRANAVRDVTAPLDADDLARLFRDFIGALSLDPSIAENFSVNTVHYYRRKDIIDPPEGRTVAARYTLRHLWQVAGARLAGHLGLVSLAEARGTMRDATEESLRAFLSARVADARARGEVKSVGTAAGATVRPLPGGPATMIPLPGDAWAVVPASHAAHHSSRAAGELARALATALKSNHSR
jgi:hypothetical protein